jgi:hypothetical protein
MVVGGLAGLVHNLAFDRVGRARIDDVAGAFPVHGACGVLGTFCAAFAPPWDLSTPYRLLAQAIGVVVALLWASITAAVLFVLIDAILGLRQPVEEEAASAPTEDTRYRGHYKVSERRWPAASLFSSWSSFVPLGALLDKRGRGSKDERDRLIKELGDPERYQILRESNDSRVIGTSREIRAAVEGRVAFVLHAPSEDRRLRQFLDELGAKITGSLQAKYLIDWGVAPGESLQPDVESALEHGDAFVVLVRPQWDASYVQHQISVAKKCGIAVLPILLDGVSPQLEQEIDALLRDLQRRPAIRWRGDWEGLGNELRRCVPHAGPEGHEMSFFGAAFGGLWRLATAKAAKPTAITETPRAVAA